MTGPLAIDFLSHVISARILRETIGNLYFDVSDDRFGICYELISLTHEKVATERSSDEFSPNGSNLYIYHYL